MTNGEIKLVVKALCYALGDPQRHYNVKVDDKGIVIEYRAAEWTDFVQDPSVNYDLRYELGHVDLPLITDLFKLSAAVKASIEMIESVGIEYKRM